MGQKQHKKEKPLHLLYRMLFIIIGAALAAFSIQEFLVPNNIIDGGIIGIAIILDYLTPLKFSILIVLLNAPFLYFGYRQIGRTFVVSTFVATVALAVSETMFHSFEPITTEPILATVFGGLILGIGVGLVIRHGGSLDGTEITGIILTKHLPFSLGEFVMFLNLFIFGWAGFIFGWEQAMYSVMMYYIAFKTIDTVIQGIDETKAFFIVSDYDEEVAEGIMDRLGRGVTYLYGKGAYTDDEKQVLYVVVTRLEVTKLKGIVNEIDPSAFLTIMNTHETKGQKFKSSIH